MKISDWRKVQRWQVVVVLALVVVLVLLCVVPMVVVNAMRAALDRLHLPGFVAGLAVPGLFIGRLFDVPLFRIPRAVEGPLELHPEGGVWTVGPRDQMQGPVMLVAANVGGCLIPLAIAAWQLWFVAGVGGWPLTALAISAGVNVAACYVLARPRRGGYGVTWYIAPLLAIGLTWLLLGRAAWEDYRPSVAFFAGVVGPLAGADLLRLRDLARAGIPQRTIGGAGTFAAVVLTSLLAVLLV